MKYEHKDTCATFNSNTPNHCNCGALNLAERKLAVALRALVDMEVILVRLKTGRVSFDFATERLADAHEEIEKTK